VGSAGLACCDRKESCAPSPLSTLSRPPDGGSVGVACAYRKEDPETGRSKESRAPIPLSTLSVPRDMGSAGVACHD
jgi:hypothetical protein